MKVKLSVKVRLFVSSCVCAILPAKAVSEMTYTVGRGDIPYSLTHFVSSQVSSRFS